MSYILSLHPDVPSEIVELFVNLNVVVKENKEFFFNLMLISSSFITLVCGETPGAFCRDRLSIFACILNFVASEQRKESPFRKLSK